MKESRFGLLCIVVPIWGYVYYFKKNEVKSGGILNVVMSLVGDYECAAWAKALTSLSRWESLANELLKMGNKVLTKPLCDSIQDEAKTMLLMHGLNKNMYVFFRRYWSGKLSASDGLERLTEGLRRSDCGYYIPRLTEGLRAEVPASQPQNVGGVHISNLSLPVRVMLCAKLDPNHPLGYDRCYLSQKLGYEPYLFKKTDDLLKVWGEKGDSTLDKLHKILWDIKRGDVAELLEPYLKKEATRPVPNDTIHVKLDYKPVCIPIQQGPCGMLEDDEGSIPVSQDPPTVLLPGFPVTASQCDPYPPTFPVTAPKESQRYETYDMSRIKLKNSELEVYGIYVEICLEDVSLGDIKYKPASRSLDVTVLGKDGYDRDMTCVCRVQRGSDNKLLSVCYYLDGKLHSPRDDVAGLSHFYDGIYYKKCMYVRGKVGREWGYDDEGGDYEVKDGVNVYKK